MKKFIDALFGSTESLKQMSRFEIRTILWPLRLASIIIGPGLSLALVAQQYASIEDEQVKLTVFGMTISILIIFGLYKKFKEWLDGWYTNKRAKWMLEAGLKIVPLILVYLLFVIISNNVAIAEEVIKSVVLYFSISYVVDYFSSPLAMELKVRDKLKLESTDRVVD
jgi:hypothetical protein